MRQTFAIVLLLFPFIGLSQKFMIKDNDTLPYSEEMRVDGNDTTYAVSCNTFIIRDKKIINRQINCVSVGYWEFEKGSNTLLKGFYNNNGGREGLWRTYDGKGKLLRETEYASVGRDTYILKETEYINGKAKVIVNKSWFAKFYLKNVLTISLIILISFFLRIPINFLILKKRYGQLRFGNALKYNVMTTFTFWWNGSNAENRKLKTISNVLSIIALGSFFGVLIGLAISGEL